MSESRGRDARRLLISTVTLVLGALALIACSGDEKDDTKATPKATSDASATRKGFEAGITSNARTYGLSPAAIGCVKRRLRAAISDEQLVESSGDAVPPAVRRSVLMAMGVCTSGSSSPRALVGRVFEAGIREQARTAGLPKQTLECALRTLRSSSLYEEILAAATAEAQRAVTRSAKRETARAFAACV